MLSTTIKNFNAPRLADMVQLKYEAMTENAFRFFRGTCHLFYENLVKIKAFPKSPNGWVCGDLHLENFGSYRGENGLIYFDMNDFDEGVLAPVLWEVVRLVTSIFVAFEVLGIGEDQAMNLANLFITSYGKSLVKGRALAIDPRTANGIVKQFLKHSECRNYKNLLGKRTVSKGKKMLLSLEHEKHFKLDKKLKKDLTEHITAWLAISSASPYNYTVKDAVFRFAGTGSLGVKRYLFLLKSTNTKGHYLLLDMKQSFESSLEPFVKIQQPKWIHHSDRIIAIQKRMQYVSSSLLDHTIFNGDTFVIQELQPTEDTFDFGLIKGDYRNLINVIDDMALLTAGAQLRSGGRQGAANLDELMSFGQFLQQWKPGVLQTALALAKQNEIDYKSFLNIYKHDELKEVKTNKHKHDRKEKVCI